MALTAGSRLAEVRDPRADRCRWDGRSLSRPRHQARPWKSRSKSFPTRSLETKTDWHASSARRGFWHRWSHPGIATLHGFFESDGVRFLVMELVEGETLEARIKRGAIPLDEAIPLFLQMSEAMEAAHGKGIIHRDLKPANVKITLDGRPKILDFGLAKGYATPESPAFECVGVPHAHASHFSGRDSGDGALHESRAGAAQSLDKRTDIWSFGCVLYEAFDGAASVRWGYGCGHPRGNRQDGAGLGSRCRTRRPGRFASFSGVV